jgi:hypothetical protein
MLMGDPSRAQVLRITAYIDHDPERFRQLITVFTEGDYRLAQRSFRPLSYCVEKYPALLTSHLPTLLDQLESSSSHAVKRNTLRLFQFAEIPDVYAGRLMTICFDLLMKPAEKIAAKAFALTVLANQARKYPEIKNEILLCIAAQLPDASPGFRARANKVTRQLEKIPTG